MYRHLGTYGGDRQFLSCNPNRYAFWSNDLLYGRKRDLDLKRCKRLRLEPRRRHHTRNHRFHQRLLHCPNHGCKRLHRDFRTYGCDGQSSPGNADNYGRRTNNILRGWQRYLEQQQPDQQYLDARWSNYPVDFRNHERHVFGGGQQWWLQFCAFECHYRDGKSAAFDANDHAFRPYDLLYRWQRQLDFHGCECLSLEPWRRYHADPECHDKRFIHGASDRRQWLFCNVCTYRGDRQSIACHADNHGSWSDNLLRWRKRHPEQQQPDQQRLDPGRCYNCIHFCNDKWNVFGSR